MIRNGSGLTTFNFYLKNNAMRFLILILLNLLIYFFSWVGRTEGLLVLFGSSYYCIRYYHCCPCLTDKSFYGGYICHVTAMPLASSLFYAFLHTT